MNPLSMIVAASENRVIGADGGMPWHFPEDLKHFKKLTMGHAIIMGRKTYESIGRPLPKRRNIVLSRQELTIDGVDVVHDLHSALSLVASDAEPFVIGGAAVYELALPKATRIYRTEIAQTIPGDTYFPELDPLRWDEVERRPGDTPNLSFVTLERRHDSEAVASE